MRRNPSRRPCRRKALSATSDGQLGSTMRRKRRSALCSMAFAAKPRSPSFAGAKALPVAETERFMKLAPADTHVAPIEDWKGERVLERTSQRCFMIVAVDADNAH